MSFTKKDFNVKRVLALALAALFVTASCAGGSGGNSGSNAGAETVVEAEPEQQVSEEIGFYHKFDPPIVVTQAMSVAIEDIWPEGRSLTNNAYTDWCLKDIGIIWEMKWIAPDNPTSEQKLNLAIASNDVPDLLYFEKKMLMKMARSGQIIPLDDLVEKYSSDLVKYVASERQAAENGMLYAPFLYQGKRYAIPDYAHPVDPQYNWYRKDILDELGLAIPTTIDEFGDALGAITAKYPNMVGVEVGKTGLCPVIMDAYGAFPNIWLEKSGELVFGSIQPEMKNALAKMAEWYAEGYFDKEFVVTDFEEKWVSGDAFSRSAMWWMSWVNSVPLTQNVPTCVLSCFPYLKGPDGFQGRLMGSGASGWGWAISSKFDKPEALLIQQNFYVDSAYRNMDDLREKFDFHYNPEPNQPIALNQDEYVALLDSGIELEKARQSRIFDYKEQGPDQGDSEGFFNENVGHTVRQGIKTFQRSTDLRDALINLLIVMRDGGEKASLSEYEQALYDQVDAAWGMMLCMNHLDGTLIARSLRDTEVRDQFLGSPTDSMVEKKAYLDKLQDETYVKIIMGEAPIDSFDQFVTDWKNNGGDEIIEEVNQWYRESK